MNSSDLTNHYGTMAIIWQAWWKTWLTINN
jgi:hypothetical protein